MAQPIDFLIHIRYFDGAVYQYYYLSSGTVTITTTQTALTYAPDEWESIEFSWERAFTYWGLFRKMSIPIIFKNDGAKILRHIFLTQGVQGSAEIYIQKLNRATYTYSDYFIGDIDFSRASGEFDGFKVSITEGGFVDKLFARESIPYEIAVEQNPNVIWVKLHECELQLLAKWVHVPVEDVNTFPSALFVSYEGTNLYLNLGSQEIAALGGVNTRVIDNYSASSQTFSLTYDYYYDIHIPPGTTTGAPYKFHLYYEIVNISTSTPTTVSTSDILLYSGTQASNTSQTYTGTNTQSITLASNEGLYIKIEMETTTGAPGTIFDADYDCYQLGSTLHLYDDILTPETYFPCLRPKNVLDDIITQLSEDATITINSTLLASAHTNKVYTCGDAIRNLPLSVMKIDFDTLYSSLFAIFTICIKYQKSTNTLELEDFVEAFDDSSVMLDLDEVADVTYEPITSELFSKMTVGYQDITYDEVNGKDEFNNTAIYSSPITRVTNSKEFKSGIRADSTGIILTALNLGSKLVTDAESDNDIFTLHIEDAVAGTIPDGYMGAGQDYYNIYRKAIDLSAGATYWNPQNIYSPATRFNYFFSPMNCNIRKGALLHSLFYGNDGKYIKYQTSSKSNYTATKLITEEGSPVVTVDEGSDIDISTLADAKFHPFIFKCTALATVDLLALFDSNPYQLITLKFRDDEYSFYLIRGAQKAVFQKGESFELLSYINNDLTKLVY